MVQEKNESENCHLKYSLSTLTAVTIILLRVKLNKMLNIKTKSDTFHILGGEEISKRTNARSWEGCDQAKI